MTPIERLFLTVMVLTLFIRAITMCVAKMGNIREFSDNVVSTISLQCDSGKLVVWVVSLARLFKVLKSELQFQETVGEKKL